MKELSRAKRDEAPQRIVGRDADGDPISRHDLDVEPPHASAQLRQHFMTGVDFHSVEAAAMDGDDDAVQIDQIVLAQLLNSSRMLEVLAIALPQSTVS